MIGRAISHYKILEKLSEGGLSMVYKGEDFTPILTFLTILRFSLSRVLVPNP